jgi:hypothetical protein
MQSDSQIGNEIEDISVRCSNFIAANSNIIIFSFLVGVMAYGYEIFNFTLSIDEEVKTFSNSGIEWAQQGRWGILLLLNLFMPESLIPFLPTVISVLFLIISCFLFFFIINGNAVSKVIFCCLFITFPSNAFFMEFNTYNFAVSIGIAIAISGVLLLKISFEKQNKTIFVLSSILLTSFAVGIYQSLIGVWLCAITLYIFFRLCIYNNIDVRYAVKFVTLGLSVLFWSIVLYKIIDFVVKILIKSSSDTYLDNFIGWRGNSIITTLKIVVNYHLIPHLAGRAFYGDKTILATWIVATILLINIFAKKGLLNTSVGCIFTFLVIMSPFTLSIVLGSPLPVRSLVGLPLMVGGLWYLSAITTGKTMRHILLIAALVVAIHNSFSITRLFYSDYLTGQEDRDFANRIIDRIFLLDIDFGKTHSIPIAFIGKKRYSSNSSIIKSETFGSSFFEYGGGNQHRMLFFLKILGYGEFAPANKEQFNYALQESANMQSWPHSGSVAYKEHMVIVKLGDVTPQQRSGEMY